MTTKAVKTSKKVPRLPDFSQFNKAKARCNICNTPRSYTNPMARCFECKNKFCFDHIYGGQLNDTMTKSTTVRDICDSCKKKFKYESI